MDVGNGRGSTTDRPPVGGQRLLPDLHQVAAWAKRDLAARYRQTSLRLLWSILQPASVILVYAFVFRRILRVDSGELPYLSFIVVGMAGWRYFTVGLSQATSLVDHSNLLEKVAMRCEVIPLSACLAATLDLLVSTVAMVVVASLQGIRPSITMLALVPVYVSLFAYTSAVAVVIAGVTVFARDLSHAMPSVQQVLFFATPVMYAADRAADEFGFLVRLNPIAQVLEAMRDSALRSTWPDPVNLAANLGIGLVLLAGAIAYLRSIEHRIVDVA